MAREIKFRAKNTKNEWVYGEYAELATQGDCLAPSIIDAGFVHTVNPETLGQYTGINEYNRETNKYDGEEIYQGFIVKRIFNEFHKDDFVGVVKELEGCWVIDNGKYSIKLWTECEENKILGNVFENPELI